jgi:fructan beta-fructosidase
MRTYEQEVNRLQYHFTPPQKWMNDPNGMVYYEGEYHLFYQHHPDSCDWGPMHWGHAVSQDLVHWEHLPIALKPDHNGYIFSGCAVVDWHDHTGFFDGGSGLVAIFTHSSEDATSGRVRQVQSLAYSRDNGRTWTMYEGNPVLEDERFVDFRDPKVFYHAPTSSWIMVLAAGNCLHLYRSSNLLEWEFASEFGTEEGCHEGVWECPDLFELQVDGKPGETRWVLVVSINPASVDGSKTQYFIGHFDGYRFVNEHSPELVLWLDHGRDNYAGVTWSDTERPLEGRVFIGWMSNWMYANATPTEQEDWRGAMTLPRRLTLREELEGMRLYQEPVEQLKRLREHMYDVRELRVGPNDNPLSDLQGDMLEINAVLEVEDARELGVKVRVSEDDETVIGYDMERQVVYFDRTKSGKVDFHERFPCRQEVPLPLKDHQIRLRIFVDRSSVEVFADDGKVVMTNLIFPGDQSNRLELFAMGGHVKVVSMDVYRMRSIFSMQESSDDERNECKVS